MTGTARRLASWVAGGGAVLLGLYFLLALLAWWRFRLPDPWVSSNFTACGEHYELEPGYLVFDYGSRPMSHVPVTDTGFKVRSSAPGASLPPSPDEIFAEWPEEVRQLVHPEFENFRKLLAADSDSLFPDIVLGLIEYRDCRTLISLRADLLHHPRPDDWSISIYESRATEPDPQMVEWLEEIREILPADS